MAALGMLLRCLALLDPKGNLALIMLNVGQVLNAAAAPMAMIIPPILSSEWFAENERTKTSNIISSLLIS